MTPFLEQYGSIASDVYGAYITAPGAGKVATFRAVVENIGSDTVTIELGDAPNSGAVYRAITLRAGESYEWSDMLVGTAQLIIRKTAGSLFRFRATGFEGTAS